MYIDIYRCKYIYLGRFVVDASVAEGGAVSGSTRSVAKGGTVDLLIHVYINIYIYIPG